MKITTQAVVQTLIGALLGAIVSLTIGYLTLVKDIYRDMHAMELRLEQGFGSLHERLAVLEGTLKRTPEPSVVTAAVAVADLATVNMADAAVLRTSVDATLRVSGLRVRVEWAGGGTRVVQAYQWARNGLMVYPADDPHAEAASGVEIPLPANGKYEIKLWMPGAATPTSAWIEASRR